VSTMYVAPWRGGRGGGLGGLRGSASTGILGGMGGLGGENGCDSSVLGYVGSGGGARVREPWL
jgi:hypothetical protein